MTNSRDRHVGHLLCSLVGVATLAGCLVSFDADLLDAAIDTGADAGISRDAMPLVDGQPADGLPDAGVDAGADTGISSDVGLFEDSGLVDGCSELMCEDDVLLRCGVVLDHCPMGCVSMPHPACRGFITSNGLPAPGDGQTTDMVFSGSLVLDACSGELDGQSIAGVGFTTIVQTGGPTIGVLQARSLDVRVGSTVRVVGQCALALVVDREIAISGTMELRGGHGDVFTPGPGGYRGASTGAAQGCGTGGDGKGTVDDTGGGGGGGFGTPGGIGGSDGGEERSRGAAGPACGTEALTPLIGGSGGGKGRCDANPCVGRQGGGGGGAMALVAGRRVTIGPAGVVNVGGAGGAGAQLRASGGGGGGSGGALLIEAPDVAFDVAVVIAAGGGGGGGVTDQNVVTANGEAGRSTLDAAQGGIGRMSGGNGGGGAIPSGQPGESSTNNAGGAGGGGGQGRVRINTRSGAILLPPINARVSQGTLIA